MKSAQYIGPHRGALRALEQNVLKYRSLQMVVVLFYAEELKNEVIDAAETHERLAVKLGIKSAPSAPTQPLSQQEKKRLARAFKALVADGVVTESEGDDMSKLIGFRHAVAHEVHNLTADLSNERWARDAHKYGLAREYDYEVAERLEKWIETLDSRILKMQRISSLRMTPLTFRAAERTLKGELKRLDRIIRRQLAERRNEHAALKREMDLTGTELSGEYAPGHPYAQYDDGRLTQVGVEVCYRLFDLGKSDLAVAHLMQIALTAARKRRKLWQAAGGPDRSQKELASIPKRKFYARYED